MLKKTYLYNTHKKNGASFKEFGGYEMPLWFKSGAKEEHFAVLLRAGLFDTSHMSTIIIRGKSSRSLLQKLTTKDLERAIGKNKLPLDNLSSVYSVYLDENAHVIDDTIIFQLDNNLYISVVNASMNKKIVPHFEHFNENCEIIDLSDKIGKIDLQGPLSVKTLCNILETPQLLYDMKPFTFKGYFNKVFSNDNSAVFTKKGYPILVSRTGYTGEIGFEIFVDLEYIEDLWFSLSEKRGETVEYCGLAARDTLRVGAKLPLSHQDIGEWPFVNNPWTFVLPYNEDKTGFTKDFLGATKLLNNKYNEYTYPFVGFDLRKVPSGGKALVLDKNNNEIGTVLTCVTEPSIDRYNHKIYTITSPDKPEDLQIKGLSSGFIKVNRKLDLNDRVYLKYGKRVIEVEIVNTIRSNLTARKKITNFL